MQQSRNRVKVELEGEDIKPQTIQTPEFGTISQKMIICILKDVFKAKPPKRHNIARSLVFDLTILEKLGQVYDLDINVKVRRKTTTDLENGTHGTHETHFGNPPGLDSNIYDTELEETTLLEDESTKKPENNHEKSDNNAQLPSPEGESSPDSEESTQSTTENNDIDRDCSNNASQASQASQIQECKCYYCPAEFETIGKHLKHSINKHPGKEAQPTKESIEHMRNEWGYDIEPKGNYWE
ncbi:MAG: hypothetical protein MRJ93_04750 [Nitrososphaeraceae archaeon]|nr:hypothetical protein [Nitrososphaeraceae archaeon]